MDDHGHFQTIQNLSQPPLYKHTVLWWLALLPSCSILMDCDPKIIHVTREIHLALADDESTLSSSFNMDETHTKYVKSKN